MTTNINALFDLDINSLREEIKKESAQNGRTHDGVNYPFFRMDYEQQVTVRFLPDGNKANRRFWVDNYTINLEFPSVIGQPVPDKPLNVRVPSMKIWKEDCPITAETQKFYKAGKDELGRKYYFNRSYIFQGFIRENPLDEETVPENPIRKLTLSKSLKEKIESFLVDPDTDYSPAHHQYGTDFRIKKTKKGNYANYDTSEFARKPSALTEDELEIIAQYGLYDLSEFLPRKPDAAAQNAIWEMFEASLNGDAYDPDRWGNYYRPWGYNFERSEDRNDEEIKAEVKEEVEVTKKVTSGTNMSELLNKIKKTKPKNDLDDEIPF